MCTLAIDIFLQVDLPFLLQFCYPLVQYFMNLYFMLFSFADLCPVSIQENVQVMNHVNLVFSQSTFKKFHQRSSCLLFLSLLLYHILANTTKDSSNQYWES